MALSLSFDANLASLGTILKNCTIAIIFCIWTGPVKIASNIWTQKEAQKQLKAEQKSRQKSKIKLDEITAF